MLNLTMKQSKSDIILALFFKDLTQYVHLHNCKSKDIQVKIISIKKS